jgi:hypothetical protein
MNRAAATLPRESQVPMEGSPARNARLTGFGFNSTQLLEIVLTAAF